MITVTVKYFAGLREAVGMTTEEFKEKLKKAGE